MKRTRKPKPELSPAIAALKRLNKDGACSNAAVRQRIALIAAERQLPPSETATLTKGRNIPLMPLGQFAEKHHLSVDWLIGDDLKAHPRGSPSRHMAKPRPRAMSDQEFVEALAIIDEKSRQFIISYMQLLVDGGGAA
jgi:hypothetical protein